MQDFESAILKSGTADAQARIQRANEALAALGDQRKALAQQEDRWIAERNAAKKYLADIQQIAAEGG